MALEVGRRQSGSVSQSIRPVEIDIRSRIAPHGVFGRVGDDEIRVPVIVQIAVKRINGPPTLWCPEASA